MSYKYDVGFCCINYLSIFFVKASKLSNHFHMTNPDILLALLSVMFLSDLVSQSLQSKDGYVCLYKTE